MSLPFTPVQFFEVFADYNRAFIAVVVALWVTSAAAMVAAWRAPASRSRLLSFFLAALWLWNAVAYHAFLFTRINPAAWLFAALFVLQAAAFVVAGRRNELTYFAPASPHRAIAVTLAAYALLYPFLTIALGHAYPHAPTFGVPCPTGIMTIGILASATPRVPLWMAVIPFLWALIGGSAAVILQVPTDYVLLAAGLWFIASGLRARGSTSFR